MRLSRLPQPLVFVYMCGLALADMTGMYLGGAAYSYASSSYNAALNYLFMNLGGIACVGFMNLPLLMAGLFDEEDERASEIDHFDGGEGGEGVEKAAMKKSELADQS
ncbi:hypothetical protein LTR85_002546 [Meristemomyces frigidus]|nr:hypothetical protein LTR85_002546 [Meristemomyces frigidus]